MASDVTFTGTGFSGGITVTPIPGTLKFNNSDDTAGGDVYESAVKGKGRDLSLEVTVTDTGDASLTSLLSIRSGVGSCATVVSSEGSDFADITEAQVGVEIAGDAIMIATITVNGTV